MFLSSHFVPNAVSPAWRTETLASTRSEPFSRSQSDAPVAITVARSIVRKRRACAASRRSGSVTISSSGVPARLKSTIDASEPAMRPPPPPTWIVLRRVLLEVRARDARRRGTCPRRTAVRRTGRSGTPWASRDRSSSCGPTSSAAGIRQPSASPTRSAWSTASRLATGSIPGCARQTVQTLVFGASPYRFRQRQNIFVCVRSCTWISSPITASHVMRRHPPREPRRHRSRSRSPARARARSAAAGSRENAGPITWNPTGRPPSRPHGIDRPGRPARLTGQREDVVRVHRERVVELRADAGTPPTARSADSSASQSRERRGRSRGGSACGRAAPAP